jgi:hypothetical protein
MRPPSEPKRGESIRQKVIELTRYARASTVTSVIGGSLKESANGKTIEIPKGGISRSGKSVILPLDVYNLKQDGETFRVAVREGYVIERTVINDTGTDCLTYHEPDGITVPPEEDPPLDPPPFPGQDPGDAIAHEVEDGQAIFVKVTVQDDGTISATEIVVDANDKESTHYAPPVGDETAGSVGEYYYKLAEFAMDGAALGIKRFHAGANIDHFQELPRFVKAGGTADVFKTFDQASGQYKTRGLTGVSPVVITQGTDDIEISLAGDGGDINYGYRALTITQDSDPPWVNFSVASTIEKWVYVRNGITITDRALVDTPDDAGTGAGEVYPRIIYLLPLSTAGTAGTGLGAGEGGGWFDPIPV